MVVGTTSLTPVCLGMMLQYMISEMKEAGNWPHAITYSFLMDGYAMVNQPHKASQVMQDCIDDGHKVMSACAACAVIVCLSTACLLVCCQAHLLVCLSVCCQQPQVGAAKRKRNT